MATLPIGAEQSALPELHEFVLDWMASRHWETADPQPDQPREVCRDQLTFGPDQQALTPEPPQARQLPLLPDPPIWEEPSSPRPKVKRRARKPSSPLSPGQMSLF